MCLFKEAELNCVKTYILLISELIQLEIGISTNRYLPAIGTAGLDLFAVKGYNLDPCPPPNIIPSAFEFIIFIFLEIYIRLHMPERRYSRNDQLTLFF